MITVISLCKAGQSKRCKGVLILSVGSLALRQNTPSPAKSGFAAHVSYLGYFVANLQTVQ